MKFLMFESLNMSLLTLLMPTVFAEPAEPQCNVYLMRDEPPALVSRGKCVSPKVYNPIVKKPKPDPEPEPDPVYLEAWDSSLATEWSGEQLEGADPACKNRSLRWNNPIVGFDINNDGRTEIIAPVSCYQGPDPEPGEYHNRSVVGAWLMFCSSDTGHHNCTSEYFGSPTIRATADDPLGGSPYTHVMQDPADINGDGYPDFWYALNRDDGRPGIDPNDPNSADIYRRLCGPQPDKPHWDKDCTWRSVQTAILSSVDEAGQLTYQVVQIPWGPKHTQAMLAVPNHLGGYDLLAFNYGPWNVARVHEDNTIEDVTVEYSEYVNVWPVLSAQPYAEYFYHEDTHYVVTADIAMEVLADPDAGEWGQDHIRDPFQTRGFTLWEWHPGQGFSLADIFMPEDQDRFVYTEDMGGGHTKQQPGAFVRGLPMYMPMWHFFEFAQLHPDEEPVLVVAQESSTTAGDYLGAQPDPGKVYHRNTDDHPDLATQLVPLNAVEAFYIRSGKLVPRLQSVIDGDALFNVPHFEFQDLTGDGLADMCASGGNHLSARVYLNDGTGTLEKVNMSEAFPEMDQSVPNGTMGFVLDLGDAPYLDVFYWQIGIDRVMEWMGADYVHTAPPMGIIPGLVSIDQFPRYTPAEINNKIKQCQLQNIWMGGCEVH